MAINSPEQLQYLDEEWFDLEAEETEEEFNEDLLDDPDFLALAEEDLADGLDEEKYQEALQEAIQAAGVDDHLKLYLNEISQIPLMTFEDEQVLGQRKDAGLAAQRELDALARYLPGNQARIAALSAIIQEGLAAREQLILANTRWVVTIAKKYYSKMDFLDRIQEGNIGLMKAVERFDYRKGFRLSTYATLWIRQAIGLAISYKDQTIRIVKSMQDEIESLKNAEKRLVQTLNRNPSIEELARELEIDPYYVRELRAAEHSQPLSLDEPYSSLGSHSRDNQTTLADFVTDDEIDTDELTQIKVDHQRAHDMLNYLAEIDPQLAQIVMLRETETGYNGRPLGWKQIGERIAPPGTEPLSRETIRLRYAKGIRIIRQKYARRPNSRYS